MAQLRSPFGGPLSSTKGQHDQPRANDDPVEISNRAMNITKIVTSGIFSQTNNCGASLAAGAVAASWLSFS